MELLNRIALVVTPKRRFVEWVNQLSEMTPVTPDEVASLRSVFLVAVGDVPPDLQDLIDTYWADIFEEELAGWSEESSWPPNRTAHTFRDWFNVESVESVVDADPNEPVTIGELARTRCAICDGLLGDDQIPVVCRGSGAERWTLAQLEAWERDYDPARDSGEAADEAQVDAVFRCCSAGCAAQAETSLAEAMARKPVE